MPCRRTLTGRREREKIRRGTNLNRSRNVNTSDSSDVDEGLGVDLIDTFKCALYPVPINFLSHNCGPMNLRCIYCNALHFKAEITDGHINKFTLCCHKGKIALPPLSQNNFFNEIYEGLGSENQLIKRKSANFFENIRKYNSSFAMVSSEAKISDTISGGIYHFKIHDNFYHRAGPMTTSNDRQPCYAQLYFYDVDIANNYRLNVSSNNNFDANLLNEIAVELNRCNSIVKSFISMREYCELLQNRSKEICMLIKVNRTLDIHSITFNYIMINLQIDSRSSC